jgi:hypothetical protein
MRVISLVESDSADIRDLKPQQRAGKPSLLWLWIILSLIAAGTAVYLALMWWRKTRKGPPPPPPKPPYDEAVEALAALEAQQYLQKGMIREHVFALSDIFKRYIGRRFETNAEEYTTEEMLAWVASASLETAQRRKLEWFFTETDPVKFAKHIPDRETIMRFGEEVRTFLAQTRPRPQSETKNNAHSGAQDAVQGS